MTPSRQTAPASTPKRPENRWNLLPAASESVAALVKAHGLHPVVARVLAARGWLAGRPELGAFLSPLLKNLRSPFELQDMELAVERTLRAIRGHEKICIYGDYDVDGVTSSALLVEVLRLFHVEPRVVIPHRLRDGYGMNLARIEEIARQGYTLIITVDTGISAVEEIRRAAELGVDVVVTDHHLGGDELPQATALINPNRSDAVYEFTRLCGVGVTFKFAHALLKQGAIPEEESKRFLLEQLDLVALGTVADVVPLLGENRVFVRHGLTAILASKRPGLQALLEVSGVKPKGLTPDFVAFGLAPRINAAGRTDDAMIALKLLLTRDSAEAHRLAHQLDSMNRDRRAIEDEILQASREEADQALRANDTHTLVVSGHGWHLGVVGIVAARLTELYDVPAIVLGVEESFARGSARSVPGFDIHEALGACQEHLETFGGHAAAAGLRLRVSGLGAFRDAINSHARGIFLKMDRTTTVDVDAELKPSEINWDLYDGLQKLQPHGEGNPAPVFLLRDVENAAPSRIVGRNHLKLRLRAQGEIFDAIGFSCGHLRPIFESGRADVLCRPVENNFNGQTKLELEIQDARSARI